MDYGITYWGGSSLVLRLRLFLIIWIHVGLIVTAGLMVAPLMEGPYRARCFIKSRSVHPWKLALEIKSIQSSGGFESFKRKMAVMLTGTMRGNLILQLECTARRL